MRSRFAIIVKVLCAVLLVVGPLAAQSRSEDAAQVQTARIRFQEGVRFYDTRQYGKARVAFTQAYALKPHPSILLNLAQSELRSGYEADAANHFAKYLREAQDSPTRKEAEKGLAKAKTKCGEITVKSNEEGVQILLDGNEQGLSPLEGPIYVTPGSHTLQGKLGSATTAASFDAVAGQSQEVALSLSEGQLVPFPEPAPTARETAAPIESETGGRRQPFFSWLGSPTGIVLVSLTAATLVAGSIALGISIDAGASADKTQRNIVTDWNGYSKTPEDTAPCDANNPNRLTYQHYYGTCQKFVDLRDRRDNARTYAIIFFVATALPAAAIPIVYFTTAKRVRSADPASRRKAREAAVQVLPILSPYFQGIGLNGRF